MRAHRPWDLGPASTLPHPSTPDLVGLSPSPLALVTSTAQCHSTFPHLGCPSHPSSQLAWIRVTHTCDLILFPRRSLNCIPPPPPFSTQQFSTGLDCAANRTSDNVCRCSWLSQLGMEGATDIWWVGVRGAAPRPRAQDGPPKKMICPRCQQY